MWTSRTSHQSSSDWNITSNEHSIGRSFCQSSFDYFSTIETCLFSSIIIEWANRIINSLDISASTSTEISFGIANITIKPVEESKNIRQWVVENSSLTDQHLFLTDYSDNTFRWWLWNQPIVFVHFWKHLNKLSSTKEDQYFVAFLD